MSTTCRTLRIVLERTLAELDAADLVAGLAHAPALRGAALASRPELVGQPAFWAKLDCIDEAFQTANGGHMKAAALAAMLAGRGDLALRAVQEFGSRLILRVLGTSWDSLDDGVDDWLKASVVDSAAVAEFLATEPAIPGPMLYALARTLPARRSAERLWRGSLAYLGPSHGGRDRRFRSFIYGRVSVEPRVR